MKNMITYIENQFNLDYVSKNNFYNYVEDTESLFNKNIIPDIDKLVENIKNNNNYIKVLAEKLSEYVVEKKTGLKMSIKYNDRDGTHLLLTNRRHKMLVQQLKNKKVKTLDILDMKIEINKFIFKETSSKKMLVLKLLFLK